MASPRICSLETGGWRRRYFGSEKTLLSRQIEATDRQIDNLVRELYGLSEEEIAIVEEAAR